MGRGKQSKEGQALRRQQIINYVREHGPVKSGDLCQALGMSRSSLSDDLRAIMTTGDVLLSPKKGLYIFNEQYAGLQRPYSKIDQKAVRRWMILLSLQQDPRTYEEILEYLLDAGIPCAENVLYKDLEALQQEGLMQRHNEGKQRLYSSSVLYETDSAEVRRFQSRSSTGSRVQISALESLNLKIKHSLPPQGDPEAADLPPDDLKQVTSAGKRSLLNEEQFRVLQDFERYPYQDRELRVTYLSNRDSEIFRDLQTGVLVYVVETSRIYLMGRSPRRFSDEASHYQYTIIPMDRIVRIETGTRANVCYDAPEFHTICREMFQISTEEPMKVRVRFQNLSFIREKIERLCTIRKTARLEVIGDELLYTDTVRGVGDLARYLRRFGRSVIVDEPASLRQRMIDSSLRTIALYEGDTP